MAGELISSRYRGAAAYNHLINMNTHITVTMSERVWIGLLIHLKDTVEQIPISAITPDPYQSVNITINKIEQQLNAL
jgi:ribosome-associated translation inhibitor RaiA